MPRKVFESTIFQTPDVSNDPHIILLVSFVKVQVKLVNVSE